MRGRSFTIGLLLDNIRNPFYGDFLDGVTDALAKTDFQVLVGSAGFSAENQSRVADAMIDRAMDGLILIASSMSRSQVIAVAKTIPAVVVGHHDTADEYDSVVDDDRAGGRGPRRRSSCRAGPPPHCPHLRHGQRRPVDGPPRAGTQRWLPAGYASAGLDEAVTIAGTSYSEEGGYQAGRELLDRPGRPTAIFAGADFAALGVLRAAYELGLRIPADLSLVGYDNTTLAASAPINLTSVDQAAHDLGRTAARLLGERMDGRGRSILTSTAPQLIVRNTTAPPPS